MDADPELSVVNANTVVEGDNAKKGKGSTVDFGDNRKFLCLQIYNFYVLSVFCFL